MMMLKLPQKQLRHLLLLLLPLQLLPLPPFLQTRHHRLRQPLTRSPLVITLPNPHLTDVLDIHRRKRRMQGHLIQQPIQRRRKEHQRHPLSRLHLHIQIRKMRRSPPGHIIEIHQNRNGPLPPIRSEPPPILIAQIKRIEMLQILLAGIIPPHLGQFAMLRRLPGQETDLPQILRQILPGQVTRAGSATGADLPRPLSHHGCGTEGVGGGVDEEVAFGAGEEVFDGVDGRVGVEELHSRVVGVDAVVDGGDEGAVLDGEGGDLGAPGGGDGGDVVGDGELGGEVVLGVDLGLGSGGCGGGDGGGDGRGSHSQRGIGSETQLTQLLGQRIVPHGRVKWPRSEIDVHVERRWGGNRDVAEWRRIVGQSRGWIGRCGGLLSK
mmetsp:Transcript_17846/g.36317  ORF Transcript_17846/g.36317 Transcript_17846/m.36317 type:complete len:379 (-) Transcript_17846:1079-2215(-)